MSEQKHYLDKPCSQTFIEGNSQEIEDLGGGIKRQIHGYNHELLVARVWFEEGAIGDVHWHKHSQVSYIESGEFEVFVDGETKLLSAGDSFYIEPNKHHGSVCKKAGVLIDVFSPLREDFLKSDTTEK